MEGFQFTLTGRQKLDMLLTDRGFPTVRSVADALDEHYADVSRTFNVVSGRPTMQGRIRDRVATLANIDRSVIDDLLGPITAGQEESDE